MNVSTAEYFAVCHTCRVRHPCKRLEEYAHFSHNHYGHATSLLRRAWLADSGHHRLAAWNPRHVLRSVFGWSLSKTLAEAVGEYLANANVKEAFQGNQVMTVTHLNSLARSVTAGWQSDIVDNTGSLFIDDLWQINLAQVNTAPANGKVIYVFAGHSIDGGTTLTGPFATSGEGTLTFPDVTANALSCPLMGTVPYMTQNVAIISRAMSMAATCGGQLPEKSVIGIINDTGETFAASGNTVKHNGVFATVV